MFVFLQNVVADVNIQVAMRLLTLRYYLSCIPRDISVVFSSLTYAINSRK